MSCSCSDHPAEAPRPIGRRTVLLGGAAAGLVPFLARGAAAGAQGAPTEVIGADSPEGTDAGPATRDFGFLPPRPASEVHQNNIMFPVLPDPKLGRATWTDTYLAPRSGGRRHEGQDLMAPKMLKLLACVDGTIVELRHRANPSGNSLYLRGDDGYYYCYLHINNDTPGTDDGANRFDQAFAPGLAIGQRVRRGQHLAFVGDSGNAEATGSHCHFEIRLPNAKWYNAAACNAKYSLQAAEPARLGGSQKVSVAPAPDVVSFVQKTAEDFLGGVPSSTWLFTSVDRIDTGKVTPDAFIEEQLASDQVIHQTNPMIRLYQAYFGGIPTYIGLAYWLRRIRSGTSLDQASRDIAASGRFNRTYDVRNDRDFIRVFFKNLYGYQPSSASVELRIRRMRSGMGRGQLVRYDCESGGYRSQAGNRTRVISVYHAMVAEPPVQQWLDRWSQLDRTDPKGMQALIEAHRSGTKYAARYR